MPLAQDVGGARGRDLLVNNKRCNCSINTIGHWSKTPGCTWLQMYCIIALILDWSSP